MGTVENKELNFKFCLILIDLNLNLNSHIWLVATILDSAVRDQTSYLSVWDKINTKCYEDTLYKHETITAIKIESCTERRGWK